MSLGLVVGWFTDHPVATFACAVVFLMLPVPSLLVVAGFAALRLAADRQRNELGKQQLTNALPPGALRGSWKPPKPIEKTIQARDGVQLRTYVVPATKEHKADKRCILFCCPLGQCGLSIFYPLVMCLQGRYTLVSWDYRGFFGSDAPHRKRRIAIHEHAEDAREVLLSAGFKQADIAVGHSMGVQVILELLCLYPSCVNGAVLFNGAHGHVFRAAFQPVFRVPLVGDFARWLVRFVKRHPAVLPAAHAVFRVTTPLYSRAFGNKLLKQVLGQDYLSQFLDEYLGTILKSDRNTNAFLSLFEELDAHSVYHLLETIEHPVLLVSGLWDTLTPAYMSAEMARLMKHATHVCDPWSSHATLLEHPEGVLVDCLQFVDRVDADYRRKGSVVFEEVERPGSPPS